jgi:hypothetical protein
MPLLNDYSFAGYGYSMLPIPNVCVPVSRQCLIMVGNAARQVLPKLRHYVVTVAHWPKPEE